jgi:hypothetical protein
LLNYLYNTFWLKKEALSNKVISIAFAPILISLLPALPHYDFLLRNLILILLHERTYVFRTPTAGLAVLHDGCPLMLVVVVLVMHESRGNEESIVVELRHAGDELRHLVGTWREAALLGGEAERLVQDVGVGAEVCYRFW